MIFVIITSKILSAAGYGKLLRPPAYVKSSPLEPVYESASTSRARANLEQSDLSRAIVLRGSLDTYVDRYIQGHPTEFNFQAIEIAVLTDAMSRLIYNDMPHRQIFAEAISASNHYHGSILTLYDYAVQINAIKCLRMIHDLLLPQAALDLNWALRQWLSDPHQ